MTKTYTITATFTLKADREYAAWQEAVDRLCRIDEIDTVVVDYDNIQINEQGETK